MPSRDALEQALAAVRQAEAALLAVMGDAPALDGRLVPAKEVAQQLRRSPRTVHRWVKSFGIGETINGRVFVHSDRLADFMHKQAAGGHMTISDHSPP